MGGDRFVTFGRMVNRAPAYFVYDRETRGELLGRWPSREAAQAHADECNAREAPPADDHDPVSP